MANLLISCDTDYYNKWAINLINSLKKFVPWIKIHAVVINPNNINVIEGVNYYYDNIKFKNSDSKIAYYQASRFLKCYELFPNNELVMSVDCDSLCTQPFSCQEFENVCSSISVLKHHKTNRWLAGLVTFGSSNQFRKEFRNRLLEKDIGDWKPGYDQDILRSLEQKYKFTESIPGDWMGFGYKKGKFITLKGEQKTASKYISIYERELTKI